MDGQRKMFRMAERKEGVSMNEVFEKIIEKLEDKRKTAEQLIMENPQDELDRIQTQTAEDFASAYHDAIEIVKQEAEQYNNGWIPCSERLPEEELKKAKKERGSEAVFPVLATINKKHIITGKKYTTVGRAFYGCYHDKNFYNSCCDKLDVIAWQPLPKPFQKGEREA